LTYLAHLGEVLAMHARLRPDKIGPAIHHSKWMDARIKSAHDVKKPTACV
jgi:hypothetical protein